MALAPPPSIIRGVHEDAKGGSVYVPELLRQAKPYRDRREESFGERVTNGEQPPRAKSDEHRKVLR